MIAERTKWRSVSLGDLFEIKHGYAFKGEYFGTKGTHIVLTPGNFFDEGGFKKKGDKEKWYSGEIPTDYILQKGDLLVAMTEQAEGLLGSSAIVPKNDLYLHNQRLGLVQNLEGIDSRFLYYLFNSAPVRQQIRSSCSGVKVRHTSPSRIYEVKAKIPDLLTQRKIAGILSAYDDLIENNLRRLKILEEMAQSLYREWFVHFRFPGHESAKLVNSPLGQIPEGWEIASVDDVCQRVTDGSHSSPPSVEDGKAMASSKDMHKFGLDLNTARRISPEEFDKLVRNGCQPRANDILITKDGANYLKHIFVVEKDLEVVLLSSIAILTPNDRINPHLLSAILNADVNKERLKNYVTGAAIPRVILKDFKRFQFLLPSSDIQQAWAKLGESTTRLCWDLIAKNQNLRRTRDLILPKLLVSK